MNKTTKFITKAKSIHGGIYDYSNTKYTSVDDKVEIICPTHGSFFQTPRNHLYKKCGCNACAVDRSKLTNTKSLDQFIHEAKIKHSSKYDYSKVKYINANESIEIICPTHGSFFQKPTTHIRGHGCKKCAVRGNTNWFKNKASKIHNNRYDYSSSFYETGKDKIEISCPRHGSFFQRAESHLVGTGCPKCIPVHRSSKAEKEIVDIIKQCGFDCITNDRSLIYPKELDIFIPEKNIAIEFNGVFWHSELGGKEKYYHLNKTKMCQAKGVQLIHIFENEWNNKKPQVIARIRAKLGKTKRIYARNCSIRQIESSVARTFITNNHIQSFRPGAIHVGLFLKDELVAVMSFGKPRFNKKIEWELLRFCSLKEFTVVGGASKLLSWFISNKNPDSIISYSDKRWNNGKLYEQLNFDKIHTSKPNYFYFDKKDADVLYSRQMFQKHKLKKILDCFDPNLSEWENMKNNGYNRIWDCGNDVFVWKKP